MSPIWKRSPRRGHATPPPGVLRRERRALLDYREERLRDLGGLLLEMYRRNRFREDLVRERCEELIDLDGHLAALDSMLGLSWTTTELESEQTLCACGAPLADGAGFCSACGRAREPHVEAGAEAERSLPPPGAGGTGAAELAEG
jgi:hypothetical protein